ncbi:DUF6114 domain-containing protein [Streptomyces hiroshimensis]|uniref:Integral membrane protein n=1 Tax=Streptomyces hiroshimensis TaxID=66424 RepID=A0ABQ2Y7X7_9ACTN|nr:DUF6114 domain-containing protein [Streptomyces hiroshimensis]GGX71870.1 hypothetical protein GCM10010324_16330 [Streptomyces hiroshimensis]
MAAGTEPAATRPRRRPWAAWRRWRKARPFWGGLAAVLAGAEIAAIPLAPLKIMLHQGIAGIPSVLMGLVMVLMGLSAWFAPQYRTLAGVVTVMLAAAALVMSNLGGFLFGTILGVIGGAMVFAWQPVPASAAPAGPVQDGPPPVPPMPPVPPEPQPQPQPEPGPQPPPVQAPSDPPAHLPHKETR